MHQAADYRYEALRRRDRRFDGRFFVGVRTTGVYCRPVCPAPSPKRQNVEFFTCAAAAEEAGFRPCLRCRPETAPGTPAWEGTSDGTAGVVARLEALGGIGPWTAQYVAMRALGEPDALPVADLGLRHAVGADGRPATPAEVARAAEAWRPWRAYAAAAIWMGA